MRGYVANNAAFRNPAQFVPCDMLPFLTANKQDGRKQLAVHFFPA